MILRVDVLVDAIKKTLDKKFKQEKVVLLNPRGKQFNQKLAENFAKLDHLILVCGHMRGSTPE